MGLCLLCLRREVHMCQGKGLGLFMKYEERRQKSGESDGVMGPSALSPVLRYAGLRYAPVNKHMLSYNDHHWEWFGEAS